MLRSMYQQLTDLDIEPENVKLPPMSWVYVHWEGYATYGRVLRDAISRKNGLKISQGN